MTEPNKSIEEKINTHLINEHIQDYTYLAELLKPTIAIKENRKNATISKFGGIPSFPSGINIESLKLDSLSFICQISVREIEELNPYDYFNEGGILYFFINPNFNYPIKKEEFKVLYLTDPANSFEEDFNIETFKEVPISFNLHYTFPSYQNWKILELEKEGVDLEEKIEDIQDFINENNNHSSDKYGSQIFGNPQALQGTVSFHWATNALNLSHPFSDKELKEIKEFEKEFLLLLQIDFSDIKITDQFGDGMLYFGITKDDLEKKNFDKVQVVYQTT